MCLKFFFSVDLHGSIATEDREEIIKAVQKDSQAGIYS